MSKADEMFEELGYSKLSEVGNNERVIIYRNTKGKYIQFNHLVKKVSLEGNYKWVDMQELQAINEKIKELGWNE